MRRGLSKGLLVATLNSMLMMLTISYPINQSVVDMLFKEFTLRKVKLWCSKHIVVSVD